MYICNLNTFFSKNQKDLEVVDGLFPVSLGAQVTVDVAESMRPALQLNQVGRLRPDSQVHGGLRIINHQRKAVLLQARNVAHHASPEQRVTGLELTLVDVHRQRHDGVAFVAGIDKGQDGHKKSPHGKGHVVEQPEAVLRLPYRTGT